STRPPPPATTRAAIACWQPSAPLATSAPCRPSGSSSRGMAVIALALSSAATCPSDRRCSVGQALTRGGRPGPGGPGAPVRGRLPAAGDVGQPGGRAGGLAPAAGAGALGAWVEPAEPPGGGVGGGGPLGSARNRRSQASRFSAKAPVSS